MDPWGIDTWLKIASLAWTVLVLPLAWFIQGHRNRLAAVETEQKDLRSAVAKDVEERFEKRAKSMGELKDRLAEIEAVLKHAPSKDDIHSLALSVSELAGQMQAMSASLKGMQSTVTRVDNYLLEHAGK